MDEILTQAIARLVDRGFDLETLTPEGRATVRRGRELIELRVEDGRVLMRGDVPRDLVQASGRDTAPLTASATAPAVEGEGADVSADVSAPGMAPSDSGERRAERARPDTRPRPWWRRWWGILLIVLLLAAVAGSLAFLLLDRPLPERFRGAGADHPASLRAAFGGAEFEEATDLAPYGDRHVTVAERRGVVWLVERETGDRAISLDLRDLVLFEPDEYLEDGLLSIAFDGTEDHLFVYYSAPAPLRTVLARFGVVDGFAERDSQLILLEVPQPTAMHRGGAVRFGPDGMLYLGIGDGGDPESAQDRGSLHGTVIRLDTRRSSPASPYAIPADNPFVADSGFDHIWAYGFRNPWRMDFDAETGELWLADVGEAAYEEINLVRRGLNYGWPQVDGRDCAAAYPDCNLGGVELPVATYEHAALAAEEDGDPHCAIIGGIVYHGAALPELRGSFIFADLCSGVVWAIDPARGAAQEGPADFIELARVPDLVYSVSRGPHGEIYLATASGPVLQLIPAR